MAVHSPRDQLHQQRAWSVPDQGLDRSSTEPGGGRWSHCTILCYAADPHHSSTTGQSAAAAPRNQDNLAQPWSAAALERLVAMRRLRAVHVTPAGVSGCCWSLDRHRRDLAAVLSVLLPPCSGSLPSRCCLPSFPRPQHARRPMNPTEGSRLEPVYRPCLGLWCWCRLRGGRVLTGVGGRRRPVTVVVCVPVRPCCRVRAMTAVTWVLVLLTAALAVYPTIWHGGPSRPAYVEGKQPAGGTCLVGLGTPGRSCSPGVSAGSRGAARWPPLARRPGAAALSPTGRSRCRCHRLVWGRGRRDFIVVLLVPVSLGRRVPGPELPPYLPQKARGLAPSPLEGKFPEDLRSAPNPRGAWAVAGGAENRPTVWSVIIAVTGRLRADAAGTVFPSGRPFATSQDAAGRLGDMTPWPLALVSLGRPPTRRDKRAQ